jgi:iron complex transport system ATP-binding protein
LELSMAHPAINVSALSLEIGARRILNRVTFQVPAGQYLVIVGPNGAGKTTLLKCLMRICPGPEGRVEICGRPLGGYTQKELAKKVGYVPQADGRALYFTAYEFVAMGRYPYLGPFSGLTKEDKKKVEEALTLTRTLSLADQSLDTLSGGERQRVFIAAALAQGAKILLLDEPTTFLDPLHQAHVHELLARLNRELNLTIVAVTHDINSAALWGDRILALKSGEVAFVGTGDELMRNDVLERVYDKTFQFAPHPTTGARIVVPDGRPA